MTSASQTNGVIGSMTANELRKEADTTKWFSDDLAIPPKAQELLENYSGIPETEVLEHVKIVRQEAFDAYPYPCIGASRFLHLVVSTHPIYPQVLSRLQTGDIYLDAGCCFGQDIRKLLLDGAPSSARMYGADIEPAFFDCGYKLFRDGPGASIPSGPLQSRFFAVDLAQPELGAEIAGVLEGKADVVGSQSVFHLFSLEMQQRFARNLVKLMKPQPGSLLFGRHLGQKTDRNMLEIGKGAYTYGHDVESWIQFWEDIGQQTGTKWKVEAEIEEVSEYFKKQDWCKPNMHYLVYSVTRL